MCGCTGNILSKLFRSYFWMTKVDHIPPLAPEVARCFATGSDVVHAVYGVRGVRICENI